jgi:hypothetical protein
MLAMLALTAPPKLAEAVGKRAAKQREPPTETSAALATEINDFFYLFGLNADVLGLPVVAGVSSGIHVMLVRSYLNPFAFFRASLVEFITRYHLLLSFVVA